MLIGDRYCVNKKIGNNTTNVRINGIVAHAYNSNTQNLRQGGYCEFEVSLVSILNARPTEDITGLSQKATEV